MNSDNPLHKLVPSPKEINHLRDLRPLFCQIWRFVPTVFFFSLLVSGFSLLGHSQAAAKTFLMNMFSIKRAMLLVTSGTVVLAFSRTIYFLPRIADLATKGGEILANLAFNSFSISYGLVVGIFPAAAIEPMIIGHTVAKSEVRLILEVLFILLSIALFQVAILFASVFASDRMLSRMDERRWLHLLMCAISIVVITILVTALRTQQWT